MPNPAALQLPSNAYVDILLPSITGKEIYRWFSSPGELDALRYYIETENDSALGVPKLIDINGATINSNGYTWQRPTSESYNNHSLNRIVTGVGKQSDRVIWYVDLIDNQSNSYYSSTNTVYNYVTLQQAVPVGKFITLDISGNDDVTTPLTPNYIISNITSNVEFKLDKSQSRGREVSSTWSIFKVDPDGVLPTTIAVPGVDYTLTLGTLSSDVIKLKFLNDFNYQVKNSCSGYTFSANPFQVYPNDLSTNSNSETYNFILTNNNFDTKIKFAQIDISASVQPNLLVSGIPFTTFQNANIVISPVVNSTTAYWKRVTLANSPIFTRLYYVSNNLNFEWVNNVDYISMTIETSPDQVTWTPNAVGPTSPYNAGLVYNSLSGVNYFKIKAQTANLVTEVSNVFSIDITARGIASPIAPAPQPTETTLTVTDMEWLDEINDKCNIVLEIRDKSTTNLLNTKYGIGPHTISLADPINYLLNYKLTLK